MNFKDYFIAKCSHMDWVTELHNEPSRGNLICQKGNQAPSYSMETNALNGQHISVETRKAQVQVS